MVFYAKDVLLTVIQSRYNQFKFSSVVDRQRCYFDLESFAMTNLYESSSTYRYPRSTYYLLYHCIGIHNRCFEPLKCIKK